MAADGGSGEVCPLYYYALLLNVSAAHSERLFRQYSRFVARFEQLVARDEQEVNMLIAHQQQDLISLTDIIGVATSVDGVLTATTIHRHQKETAALRTAHQKAERTLEKQLQKYWLEYALGLTQDVLQALPLQNFQTMWRWGEYLLKPPQDTLCGLPDHTFGGLSATPSGPSPTRANPPTPSSGSSTMKSSGGSPASTAPPSGLRAAEAGASSMVISTSANDLPWKLPCSSCGLLAYVIPYYGVPVAVFALRHASPEASSSYLHTRHPVVLNLSSTYDLALCLGKRAIRPSSSSSPMPTALSTSTSAGTGTGAGAAIAAREDDTAAPARSVRGRSTGESSSAGGGAMPSDSTGSSTTAAAKARAELDDAIATLVMGSSQHQRGMPPRRQSSHSPSRSGRPHNGGSGESVPASSSSSTSAASHVSVEAVAQMMRRLRDRRCEAAGDTTTNITICTPAEQELHASFRECMVAQHLHGLCLEAYSMLLLIGSAARANQLLDSVHSPELLLPGHSYHDRWSTLVDETESEGILSSAGRSAGRPLHGQLYIRTSTRFWGAQVILLYTPAPELTEVELDRELGFMLRYVLDVAERWGVSTLSIALLGGPSPTALPVRSAAVNAVGDVDGNSNRRSGGTTAAAATATATSAPPLTTQTPSAAPPPRLSAQHHSWGSAISETQALMIALLRQLRQCLDYKRDVHHRPLYGSQAFSPQCCPPDFFHRTRNAEGAAGARLETSAAATATTSPSLKVRNSNNNSIRPQFLRSTSTNDGPHDRPYLHLFLPIATAEPLQTTNAATAAAAVDHSNIISLDTATDLVAPKKRWTGAGGGFLQTIIGNSKATTTNGISSIFSATGPPMSPAALAAATAAAAQLGASKNRSPPRRGSALQAEMSAAFRYAQLTFPEATHLERFLSHLYETPVSLV